MYGNNAMQQAEEDKEKKQNKEKQILNPMFKMLRVKMQKHWKQMLNIMHLRLANS